MADTTQDIWNDDDGDKETRKRAKQKKRRGTGFFALTLVVVLGIVMLAAYRDGTGFDVLRRYFNYGSADASGGETVYEYDASSHNQFALLGERLAVLSDVSLSVRNKDGTEAWSMPVNMRTPALVQGGGTAVAYDVGGTALHMIDAEGEIVSLTADEAEPYIAVTVNEKGWMAVTSKKQGLKGYVGVYNSQGELVFEFNSARRFVGDAYVTNDCSMLAAVTMGQENSIFVSNVVLYHLTAEEPAADYDIFDGLVLQTRQKGQRLVSVSDTCLTFADTAGEVTATYGYGGAYLREFDMGGDDFTALLLNRYQSGSVGRLVTVGTNGEEIGSLEVRSEIQNISACGRYLAVLYLDQLVVYNEDLQVYASLKGVDTAREVLMRRDGSALLLSTQSAGLFLP